jgi:hypothetical protein
LVHQRAEQAALWGTANGGHSIKMGEGQQFGFRGLLVKGEQALAALSYR